MSKRSTVLVYYAAMAKQLLKLGYQIVDLKKDKFDKDGKKTVFVFKNENNLEDVIGKMIDK